MRLLPLIMFIALSLVSPGLWSAGEPYGRYFVEAQRDWPEEALPEPVEQSSIPPEESAELIRALREQLLEQEYRDGPYAMSLAETLDSLARAEESTGDIETARRSRARALHLIRVNDGLYSVAQRPVLRAMLDSLRREGNFTALDERYEYFFRLYGSGRPPWDGLRWTATLEYLRWQREALRIGLDRDPINRLLNSYRMHEDLIDVLAPEEGDVDFPRLKDASFSLLKTLYLIEDIIEPRPLSRERTTGFSNTDDPRNFNLQQERLENLQRSGRALGRDLLDELLESTPPEDRRGRARIQLALADWLQWHGTHREARDLYEAIWADLKQYGFDDLLTEWFSKPVPLPDNGVFRQSDSDQGAGPITVRLSVRSDGRGRADISAVPQNLQRSASALQRYIASTRFRPAIDQGRVTATDNIPVSYWVLRR